MSSPSFNCVVPWSTVKAALAWHVENREAARIGVDEIRELDALLNRLRERVYEGNPLAR